MAPPVRKRTRSPRFDTASILMLPAGILIVLGAQMLEGGAPQSLLQAAAGLIVFGGTTAAVLVSYSPHEVMRAIRAVVETFRVVDTTTDRLAQRLVAIAGQAHRKGLMALETELNTIDDQFLAGGPRVRSRGWLCPDARHPRRGARPYPGDAALVRAQRAWLGHRRGVRGDGLRSRLREPDLSAARRTAAGACRDSEPPPRPDR